MSARLLDGTEIDIEAGDVLIVSGRWGDHVGRRYQLVGHLNALGGTCDDCSERQVVKKVGNVFTDPSLLSRLTENDGRIA